MGAAAWELENILLKPVSPFFFLHRVRLFPFGEDVISVRSLLNVVVLRVQMPRKIIERKKATFPNIRKVDLKTP